MRIRKITRRNRLRHFIRDGVGSSACDGLADNNFNAYALALAAAPGQLGLLASLQSVAGCWLQLWCEKLVRLAGSRKRMVLACVSLQALTLAAMLAAILAGVRAVPFMALSLLFTVFGSVSGTVWNSWVSDLLPARRRGFCFGVRNQRVYPVQFVAVLAAGFLLQNLERALGGAGRGTQSAFLLVFSLALGAKLFSLHHLARQPEAPGDVPHAALGPLQLLAEAQRDPALRRIVLVFSAMGFGTYLSAPFQAPYMLQTLKLGYVPFSLATAALVLARFVAGPHVGRMVDRVGWARPLVASTALLPFVPLGWAVSGSFAGILVTQALTGFIWTAYDLSVFTFLTESAPSERRQRAFSLRQVSWSLSSSLGAMAGGALLTQFEMPRLVFLAAAVARLAAAALVLKMVSDALAQPARRAAEARPRALRLKLPRMAAATDAPPAKEPAYGTTVAAAMAHETLATDPLDRAHL